MMEDGVDSPAVSGVTDAYPSTPSTRGRREDVGRVNDQTLADLVDNPITPVRRMRAAEAEDLMDEMAMELNPGAPDSDDEEEDANDADALGGLLAGATIAAEGERTEHEAENAVALENEFIVGLRNSFGLEVDIQGAPPGWKRPGPPDDWTRTAPKVDKGEPPFEEVDNPGNWSDFVFRPKFDRKKGLKYLYHCLPTGATVVPKNENGKRMVGEWEFHYDGYTTNPSAAVDAHHQFRSGATKENIFPESRKGCLDGDILKRLGLTPERMRGADGLPDAFFFYQLLLPIHDTARTVRNDPRVSYYQRVNEWSLLYAVTELGLLTSGYGTYSKAATAFEFVQWDGSIIMDGVLGGSQGAFFRHFDSNDTGFLPHIASAFTTKERWHSIKRVYKLNNNQTSPKRGEEGYNPAYKYHFIYETLIRNLNSISFKADDDQCIDETTFPFNGFGEPGAGLIKLVLNKPGVTKGAQLVITTDVGRLRPRAFVHRHNKHEKLCKQQGPNEIRLLHRELKRLMAGGDAKVLFQLPNKLFLTADNFFSGEESTTYVATEGFGCCFTNRRDRLPKDIPEQYLQKGKTDSNQRPRAARFMNPIVATKTLQGSTIQLVSFQSTSSCNIMCVNALNSCELYAATKERGRGLQKRKWGIEMNQARRLYLSTYNQVDRLDHLIQSCRMGYRSWKYWHAGMSHGKAMAVVVAYDMYLECCEGKLLNGEWKIDERSVVSFHEFRQKLAIQMLGYDPRNRVYPGDERFRHCSQEHSSRRRPPSCSSSVGTSNSNASSNRSTARPAANMTNETFIANESRCCEDLSKLKEHISSVQPISSDGKARRTCVVCGKNCYHKCSKCNKSMHWKPTVGRRHGCFFDYHDTVMLGLCRSDFEMMRDPTTGRERRQREWIWPTQEEASLHATKVRRMLGPSRGELPLPASES
jgi:hypothetical protein